VSIEIRHPAPGEAAALYEASSTAFLARPDIGRVAAQFGPLMDPDRTWAAWDGDRACGTFQSWPTELTLPGGRTLPAAAVAGVTVLPTHRRRGILTQMTAAAHRGIVEAGEPLAVLIAAEYPIYGRFGYGPATRDARITVDARRAAMRGSRVGSLELAPRDATTRDVMRSVFNAARRQRAGEIRRLDITWDLDTGLVEDPFEGERWNGFIVLHRNVAGDLDGYARYLAVRGDRGAESTIEVEDLQAIDDDAYADLWRYLLSVDLIVTVRAVHRPLTEPLPWLLEDARAVAFDRHRDVVWVRLFDIPRSLEARAYERAGSLVLELVDDGIAGGRRRWRLDASPDGAACRATDASPDLTIPVAALGAAYLGGTRLRDAARATGVEEHRAGALALADALFRAADEPWCSTPF
jgi:predicted acetyltransferase